MEKEQSWSDIAFCGNCKHYPIENMDNGRARCQLLDQGVNVFYNCASFEQKEKVHNKDYFDRIDKVKKLITFSNDTLEVAREFIKIQPVYYDKSKMWWMWNFEEYRWTLCDETEVLIFISENSYQNTVKNRYKGEMLEALRQVGRKNKPKDAEKHWIQFHNQVYDIKNNKTFEATPEYFITNPIPWSVGENGDTPTMDKLFESWVGKDYVKTLYQIIAYCLLPDYPLHRLFCFMGEGSNGKSQYMKLVKKFLGIENITSVDLDLLIKSRFECAKLYKKLLCQMGEIDFEDMQNTNRLKRLTGEDLMGFEFKNKNPFDDYNYAKIMINTNNLPATSDKTIGFYRRWLIIDFPNSFNETKDIVDSIPEIEYRNLCIKCVMYLKQLLSEMKFHNEGSVQDRMEKYEEKSNPFDKFMNENVDTDSYDGYIFKYEFRQVFGDWLKDNKFRQMTDSTIAKRMRELGIEDGKKDANWYEGEGQKQYRVWLGITWKQKKSAKAGNPPPYT